MVWVLYSHRVYYTAEPVSNDYRRLTHAFNRTNVAYLRKMVVLFALVHWEMLTAHVHSGSFVVYREGQRLSWNDSARVRVQPFDLGVANPAWMKSIPGFCHHQNHVLSTLRPFAVNGKSSLSWICFRIGPLPVKERWLKVNYHWYDDIRLVYDNSSTEVWRCDIFRTNYVVVW